MDATSGGRTFSQELLDTLLPEELDWERLVTTYPLTALAIALAGGFWLGRKSGDAILESATESATRNVRGMVGDLLGEPED